MASGWNIMSYNRTRMLDIKMAERAIQSGGMSRPTGRACAICFKNKREEYFKNKVHRIIDKEQRHVGQIISNQEREFLIKQFTDKGIVPIEARLLPDIDDSIATESIVDAMCNGLDPLLEEEEMDDVPVFFEQNKMEERSIKKRRSLSCNDLSVFSNILEKLPVKQRKVTLSTGNVVNLPPIDLKQGKKHRPRQRGLCCLYPVSTSGKENEGEETPLMNKLGIYKQKITSRFPPLSPINSNSKLTKSLPNLSGDSNKTGRRPFASLSTYPLDTLHESQDGQALIHKLTRTLPSEMAGQIATRQFQIRGLEEPLKRRKRLLDLQREKMGQNVLEDPRWRRLADSLTLARE